MSGCGRAARKRKKKRNGAVQSGIKCHCVNGSCCTIQLSHIFTSPNMSSCCQVSLSHQPEYVELLRFLHQRGFASTPLQPALFPDTGRGLQALRSIKPNQLLISLPESCLLTTSTVLDSYLGRYIKSWMPRPSPLLALCVFLVCERHRGADAEWSPYIRALPASYTCPAYLAHDVAALLPVGLRRQALEQKDAVREMHSSNQDFFKSDSQKHENVGVLSRWAWCSVNTRSVFMRHPSNQFLCGQDDYALAPFLDLLNHRPDVQVKAGFNHETKSYEIRSVGGTPRFLQAFINYGSHDNQRLLLEYGFVAAGNPHSVVYLDAGVSQYAQGSWSRNGTSGGPCWRLMTVLRLMSLPQTLRHQWKAVLRGQAVGVEAERTSLRTAKALCRRLLLDTLAALDKVRMTSEHHFIC
uniref:SET domain containing 4 n=1 Tax=Hippocampus comes TaxID=109280 RepID=A0A3Q2ZNN9_HIPCM